MLIVGSSIAMVGKASGASTSAMVSPISKSSNPTTAHKSPAATSSTFFLPNPSKTNNSLIFDFTTAPSRLTSETVSEALSTPRCNLPMAMRPVKEEKSKDVISIWVFPSLILGVGICSTTASNSGATESV